jgi:hypothetical protein
VLFVRTSHTLICVYVYTIYHSSRHMHVPFIVCRFHSWRQTERNTHSRQHPPMLQTHWPAGPRGLALLLQISTQRYSLCCRYCNIVLVTVLRFEWLMCHEISTMNMRLTWLHYFSSRNSLPLNAPTLLDTDIRCSARATQTKEDR